MNRLRIAALALAVLLTAGCPKWGGQTLKFDARTKMVTFTARDLRADSAAKVPEDLKSVLDYVKAVHKQGGTATLFEDKGRLSLAVRLRARPEQLLNGTKPPVLLKDMYQISDQAPVFLCDAGVTSTTTNGTVVPEAPECVMWPARTTDFQVTRTFAVKSGSVGLLPAWKRAMGIEP